MIAYLDAGSASMVVGAVAAGAAGMSVAIKSRFAGLKKGKGKDKTEVSEEPVEAEKA